MIGTIKVKVTKKYPPKLVYVKGVSSEFSDCYAVITLPDMNPSLATEEQLIDFEIESFRKLYLERTIAELDAKIEYLQKELNKI